MTRETTDSTDRRPPPGGSALLGPLALVGTAVLFSTGGAAVKASALGIWQIASLRCLIAAVGAGAVLWLRQRRAGRSLVGVARNPRHLRLLLAVAAAQAATLVLFVAANRLTTAANTIFLQSTAPLYVLLLGPRVLGERARRRDLLLMGVFAVGIGLFLLGVDRATAIATDPPRGNLLGLIAGLTWALTLLGLRRLEVVEGREGRPPGGRSLTAVTLATAIAGLATLPLAWPIDDVGLRDWLIVGYLGLFQITAAYLLLGAGLARVPALGASLILLADPVLSPLWAWWIYSEAPSGWALAGGAVILAATALHSAATARRRDPPPEYAER